MKRIILLILIPLFISCAGTYQQASHTIKQVYIGMPIKEFYKITGKKTKLEVMESGYTVYRMHDYNTWTGALTDTKFFYFDSNAKLHRVANKCFCKRAS